MWDDNKIPGIEQELGFEALVVMHVALNHGNGVQVPADLSDTGPCGSNRIRHPGSNRIYVGANPTGGILNTVPWPNR